MHGEIDGVFAHIIDVTDMVEARKRVEESERQFRTLAETIPHLAWMADEARLVIGKRIWVLHFDDFPRWVRDQMQPRQPEQEMML